MFTVSLDYQGFDALDSALGELMLRAENLAPVAEDLRAVMVADNTERSLSGVDLNGVSLEPLTTYTLLTRKGTGPPLAPEGGAALIVSDYVVDVDTISPYEVVLRGHWPGAPWMRFHVTGYTNNRSGNWVPTRNPAGITPQGQEAVATTFERFVAWVVDAFAGAF